MEHVRCLEILTLNPKETSVRIDITKIISFSLFEYYYKQISLLDSHDEARDNKHERIRKRKQIPEQLTSMSKYVDKYVLELKFD